MGSLPGKNLSVTNIADHANQAYDIKVAENKRRVKSDGIKYRARKQKAEPCEKFVIRFPKGMRTRVHIVANQNRRSMNKEIIARLEHSLQNFKQTPASVDIKFNTEEQQEVELVLQAAGKGESGAEVDVTLDVLLNLKLQRKLASLSFEKRRVLLEILSRQGSSE